MRRKQPWTKLGPDESPTPCTSKTSFSDKADGEDYEPFYVTFFKVGATLAMLVGLGLVFITYDQLLPHYKKDTFHDVTRYRHPEVHAIDMPREQSSIRIGVQNAPHVRLPETSQYDAFGIMESHFENSTTTSAKHFFQVALSIRESFAEIYGGVGQARSLLDRGLASLNETASTSIALPKKLAHHISLLQLSTSGKTSFQVVVVGGSAAASYGNYHDTAYSFVVERILRKPMQALGLEIKVHNLAMHDLTEFPISWCLKHATGGEMPDLLIYDYDESPPARFEAFLRHLGAQIPFFMFLSPKDALLPILKYYAKESFLQNPVLIRDREAARPWRNVAETQLPKGFRLWDHFDSISGTPDKTYKNRSRSHQNLIGWLIAMRLLSALQLSALEQFDEEILIQPSLPAPLLLDQSLESQIFLGGEYSAQLECFTSFEWVSRSGSMRGGGIGLESDVRSNLQNLVLRDSTIGEDSELLLPKTAQWFTKRWTLDLDTTSKRNKLRTKGSDFLGFMDWKKAFWGVPQSGPLSLLIPVSNDIKLQKGTALAQDFMMSLIVCGAETRSSGKGSCDLEADVSFSIGGHQVASKTIDQALRSSKESNSCVEIVTPPKAKLTTHRNRERETTVGVEVSILVSNQGILWNNGACSVAFVIPNKVMLPPTPF
jgi:hypothetical protein